MNIILNWYISQRLEHDLYKPTRKSSWLDNSPKVRKIHHKYLTLSRIIVYWTRMYHIVKLQNLKSPKSNQLIFFFSLIHIVYDIPVYWSFIHQTHTHRIPSCQSCHWIHHCYPCPKPKIPSTSMIFIFTIYTNISKTFSLCPLLVPPPPLRDRAVAIDPSTVVVDPLCQTCLTSLLYGWTKRGVPPIALGQLPSNLEELSTPSHCEKRNKTFSDFVAAPFSHNRQPPMRLHNFWVILQYAPPTSGGMSSKRDST